MTDKAFKFVFTLGKTFKPTRRELKRIKKEYYDDGMVIKAPESPKNCNWKH